jgi:hypothetical protein
VRWVGGGVNEVLVPDQLERAPVVESLEKGVLPNAAGQLSTSLSFGGNPTVAATTMWVESPDKYRRNLQNYYYR